MTSIRSCPLSLVSSLITIIAICPLAFGQTNVVTQHNDIGRTGQSVTETVLTTNNVNSAMFGQIYSLKVDGAVYTQPLYLSSLNIGGVNHSVVFIETEHDSVYAFDAKSGAQLWHVTMTDAAHGAAAGATSDPVGTTGCTDVSIDGAPSEWGISGTPVIDSTAGIIYLVSRTFEGIAPVQRLHALDVTTGLEKLGPPTTISASATGTGNGSSGGVVAFNPTWQNQRVGLLLLNGNLYLGFASMCDFSGWHGWILGYNATTLVQTGAFITSPNGVGSGVWMGGTGISADVESGIPRLFPVTGNGTFDATSALGTNNVDYGDDVLRLNVANGITVADMFTPSNQEYLEETDNDLGSAGTVILPDQPGAYPHLLAQLGKQGYLYLLNRDNLGGYNTSSDQVVQKITLTQAGGESGLWGSMAYWNNSLYVWPRVGSLTVYPLSNGLLATTPSHTATPVQGTALAQIEGVTPSISANGTSSGIVWAVDPTYSPQIAYAFDASNLSMLWNSTQNSTRDGFTSHLKQTVPTIADGKVFIGQSGQVNVYGLLSTVLTPDFSLTPASAALDVPPGTSASTTVTVTPLNGFSGALNLSLTGLPTGVTATLAATSSTVVTLTLAAASSAPNTSSPATVTVTATSGSVSHSVTYSVNVNKVQVVNMSGSFNVYAIFNDGKTPADGGFDGQNYAYSATELGTTLNVGNIPYYFGTPGQANAVSGITVALPAGNFASLNLAAAGAGTTNQNFVVTYSDGTTTTFTQSISNWGYPAGYSGETIASTMPYRITPSGVDQNGPWYLFSYSFALNSAKTVQSVTLPSGTGVVVLAMTLLAPNSTLTPQTISFGGISAQTASTSLTLSASASSGLAVGFASSTTSVCTVSGKTASLIAAGTCSIMASQSGNATYAAATPVMQSFSVAAAAAAAQTITFNAIPTQAVGTPLTLSATASSGLAVSFTSSTTSVCKVAGATATFPAAGTCTITASQAGTTGYAAATPVSQSFSVQSTTGTAGYDVVLLVGQSNMVGLGTGADDVGDAAADPRILQWNPISNTIVPAFDPLYQNSPFYNIGMGMTFAKAYVTHMASNRKLLLVGAATGATGFVGGYWLTPSGAGVTTALSWANAAMAAAGANAHLVGILWHQGENDIADGGASAYESNLQSLISYFRSNITGASSATPFVAGEMVNPWLTYNLTASSSSTAAQITVLNDFHTLPDTVPYTAWASAAELASDPYYSTIHFSALSQRQLGRRYADKFFEAQNNLPQPQVSQKWWAGTFYDDGRGLGSLNTNSIPVNSPATVNGTLTEVVDAVRGNVAKISGGQGYLSYQVPGSTFNASYTKMAWFLPGASGYGNNLISANNSGQIHFLYASNSGSGNIQIAAGHSSGVVSTIVSKQVTNGAGAWMNIAVVYNASAQMMTLYLNGAVIASQTGVAAAPSSSASVLPVDMGSYGGASGLDGELAGSRVWNVALSTAQVAAIYNYESVGTANEPGFGIVVGTPSQASNPPGTANTIPYTVPSFVAAAGGVISAPITIVPNNGFTGTPALSLTGLPAGTSYTLSPAAAANSYTLQITGVPSASAPVVYPLVLSGTSGTVSAEAAATLCLSVADSAGNLHVNLSCAFDQSNYLVSDGTKFVSGLVGTTVAYSATLLGTTVTSGSVQFSLGPPNGSDGLSSAKVNLPAGQYTSLALLGTGIYNQTSQVFTVTYTDGTTSTFTQSLSDWATPQGYAGETIASTMAYVDTSTGGTSTATVHLYSYSFALNSAKTLASITLPTNADVIVMAMTLTGTAKATPGFALSAASASATVTAGSTATDTITITPKNGFSGGVSLSVSGLPTGVIASFGTNPATSSSVLTLTASSTAAAGTSTLTVTGTSGSLTTTTTLSLRVAANTSGCVGVTDGSGNVHVNLSCSFNQLDSLVTDGTKFSTGLIGSSVAYSATLLGTTVTSGNVQFSLGAPNGNNSVSSTTVALPAGQYASLSILGTAIYNQASQTFTVTYSDGVTSTFTQSLSDWLTPQGYTGEATASTMSHIDQSNGTTAAVTAHLYSYSFALNSSKTVASITLPSNADVLVMAMTLTAAAKATPGFTLSAASSSVGVTTGSTATDTITINPTNGFTGGVTLGVAGLPSGVTASFGTNPATSSSVLTLTAASTAAAGTSTLTINGMSGSVAASTTVSFAVRAATSAATMVSLSSSNNVNAFFSNGSTVTNGGFDTASYAFSGNLLGSGLTALGVPYSFGSAGQPNGVANVTVPLPAGTYGHLDLLGASAFGPFTNQQFTVTYTDGSTSAFTQSISDWGAPQKYSGESIASAMAYRLTSNGSQQAYTFNLYGYSFALNAAKTVKSVTLPATRLVVILAMTLTAN